MPFTPEELEKLESLLKKSEEENKQTETKVETQAAPKGDHFFTVNFGGKEIRYKDNEDLQAQLEQERELQLREAQAAAYLQAQQRFTPKQETKTEEGEKFDQDTYARLFVTEPVKAQEYIDKFKKRDDSDIKQMQVQLSEVAQVIATQQFLNAHPDYEPTEVNKQAILGVLQSAGMPWTAQNLSMAYSFAKDRGMIKGKPQAEGDEEIEQPQPKKAKPPAIPRKATQNSDAEFIDKFESLPLNKMREVLESMQA